MKTRLKIKKAYRTVYKGKGLEVVEFEPQCRIIKTAEPEPIKMPTPAGQARYRNHSRYLSLPYVQFAMHKDAYGLWTSFSQKPITSDRSLAYLPCLPNISVRGAVCLDNYNSWAWGKSDISISALEGRINYFWQSEFIHHEAWPGANLCTVRLGGYEKWEKLSKKDPSFILTVKLGEARQFRSLLYDLFHEFWSFSFTN